MTLTPLFPEQLAARETEQRMLGTLLAAAHRRGWLAYHAFDTRTTCTSCGARYPVPPRGRGFPDLVLVKAPRLIVRELKSASGRITPDQQAWVDELRNSGVDAGVTRPTDVSELLDAIIGRTSRAALEVR